MRLLWKTNEVQVALDALAKALDKQCDAQERALVVFIQCHEDRAKWYLELSTRAYDAPTGNFVYIP